LHDVSCDGGRLFIASLVSAGKLSNPMPPEVVLVSRIKS